MAETQFDIISEHLDENAPRLARLFEGIMADLPPHEVQELRDKAGEAQFAEGLEDLKKIHPTLERCAGMDELIARVGQLQRP
jgi:hypothetical protein